MAEFVTHDEGEPFDELLTKMNESAFVVMLYGGETDAKLAIEIGVAVLLDKPMILHDVAANAPSKLLALADELVVGSLEDPDTARQMVTAISRLVNDDDD